MFKQLKKFPIANKRSFSTTNSPTTTKTPSKSITLEKKDGVGIFRIDQANSKVYKY